MRTLLLVLIVSACGGSTPEATEAQPVTPDAAVEDPFVTMERFKERMCTCADKACAQTVVKELTAWGNTPSANVTGDADKARMYDLSMATGDCAKRALGD